MIVIIAVLFALAMILLLLSKKRQVTNIESTKEAVIPEKGFTYEELAQYNGIDKPQIYLAIKHTIFDVTSSNVYHPGKAYHGWTGKDCTIGLGKMSFQDQHMNRWSKSRPTELTPQETARMEALYNYIKVKFPVVGTIIETTETKKRR